jgi:uncharacterized membrane protein (DUF485 family)
MSAPEKTTMGIVASVSTNLFNLALMFGGLGGFAAACLGIPISPRIVQGVACFALALAAASYVLVTRRAP